MNEILAALAATGTSLLSINLLFDLWYQQYGDITWFRIYELNTANEMAKQAQPWGNR